MKRWLIIICGVIAVAAPAQAEMYVAGQVGATVPYDLSNVEWSVGNASLPGNDLLLHASVVYGAKFGYYFDSLKWLGVETEVFNSTPHLEQQNVSIGGVNFGTIPGINLRILMWAPVNIVVRYQAGDFEPYAGVGLGVFFSRLSAQDFSSSSTDVGLNTQVGVRMRLTPNWALFGEWKFNHASIDHKDLAGTGLNLSADYNAHSLVFGVGYHF